jgi:molybdopterin-guanine dinucleotide biosynthesis protein MobB
MSESRFVADRSVNVVAFIGRSGAGKTTAIVGLIAHFVAAAHKVAAIKHTHHPLNEEDRGDTAKFRRAGADPVILVSGAEAVVYESDTTRRVRFSNPRELLAFTNADMVFAEGFKAIEEWPRIELNSDNRRSTTELLEILDKIWRP